MRRGVQRIIMYIFANFGRNQTPSNADKRNLVFMRALEKTTINSQRLGRQGRSETEPGTSRLQVLRAELLRLMAGTERNSDFYLHFSSTNFENRISRPQVELWWKKRRIRDFSSLMTLKWKFLAIVLPPETSTDQTRPMRTAAPSHSRENCQNSKLRGIKRDWNK